MTHTPRTTETYTSRVPALKVLMALGSSGCTVRQLWAQPPRVVSSRAGAR